MGGAPDGTTGRSAADSVGWTSCSSTTTPPFGPGCAGWSRTSTVCASPPPRPPRARASRRSPTRGPQVALVDLHLPDDDGLSLCLRTRSLPSPPRVIIYSAFADAGLAVRAVIAGAEGVLPKATAPRALLDALRDGGRRRRSTPRALRAVGRTARRGRPADPRDARARRGPARDRGHARARAGVARGPPLGDAGAARPPARDGTRSRPREPRLRQYAACPREIRSSRR